MASTLRFDSGPTFTFLCVLTSEGLPLTVARLVEEVIEAAGVRGRRWRSIHQQFPVLTCQTLAEAADFAAARTLAQRYLAARIASQTATLTIDIAGALYAFPGAHVGPLQPVPLPGQVVGPAAGASSLAHVRCAWSIELTRFGATT